MANADNIIRRARRVREAIGDLAPEETLAVPTPRGTVHIDRAEVVEDGVRSYVDVWLTGSTENGERNYRIVNPPLLVPDPTGEHIGADGQRYRYDPAAAVAQVIADFGGARSDKKGRGR